MSRYKCLLLWSAVVLLFCSFPTFSMVTLPVSSPGNKLLRGIVIDDADSSTLIGAAVMVVGMDIGETTDVDGRFVISGLLPKDYSLEVSYLGYSKQSVQVREVDFGGDELIIRLKPESSHLQSVVVSRVARKNTDLSLMNERTNALVQMEGISAQQIKKSGDSNASEVIKRVPGISLMDSRFVMIRGLSQRYNNVRMNGAAVPSSEADSRVFSFDLIPGSQLDNMMVIKTPAPEYPADFAGGCILIKTKDVPEQNSFSIEAKLGVNDQTHFRPFYYNRGSRTDFLGFDDGKRRLQNAFPAEMNNGDPSEVDRLTRAGFNNDWSIQRSRPIGDLSLNSSLSRLIRYRDAGKLGLLAAVSYRHTYLYLRDVSNNRYGLYNTVRDEPTYTNKYVDNQSAISDRLGVLANISLLPGGEHRFSFKNNLNILGINRYTMREGYQNQSQLYHERQYEYYYNSRLTYTSQFEGVWQQAETGRRLSYTAGYSYANNRRPDRRLISQVENDVPRDERFGQMMINQNAIRRDFSYLNEHSSSFAADYKSPISIGDYAFEFKSGLYGEWRTRSYRNREFFYRWKPSADMPKGFEYGDPVKDILTDAMLGVDKLFIFEDVNYTNSYRGHNWHGAGYISANLPLGPVDVYAGVRFESNRMQLVNYTHLYTRKTETRNYDDMGFFPSVNLTYKVSEKQRLRLAYGHTINRPEFREASRSVYYDFDLFSDVMGNPEIKSSYIHNGDLRYEYNPSAAELISVTAFYKLFETPIEWSYLDAGGSYTYLFRNARRAFATGIEAEVRKNLDFLSLNDFSLVFNGAYIHSRVSFEEGSLEEDRPMQGQSPYIINCGLFYQSPSESFSAAILYNRIGKRIVGVGRIDQSDGASINNNIPDSYEMPRNMLDLSFSYKPAERWEIKLQAQNLLNAPSELKQFPVFIDASGVRQERAVTTKRYHTGRTFSLSLTCNI